MSTRLFVAIDAPDHVKADLESLQLGVPGARWLDADQMHLTLRFLGDIDGALRRDIESTLNRVRVPAFEIQLEGVGYFPPRGEIKTLWAGVARSEPLVQIRRWVDGQLTRLGVEPDRRKFVPHVTVARLTEPPPTRVARWVAEHGLYRSDAFDVEAIHLFSSHMHRKSAHYEHEAAFLLR
ncbi:MAG: 2'-5' RNA ligase [Myxococcota bacterium]|jgi:2'-5' RNA ligase